jgi:predicted nucleic acid-binding protein
MGLTARYLADKSALARFSHPAVEQRLRPLIEEGMVATCAIIDLEVLYSARNATDYRAILEERRGFESVPITPEVMGRALEVQGLLAQRGQHRVPIPDLILAAAAESVRLAVIHYDADFERIARVTKQKHEWVVPRGTV